MKILIILLLVVAVVVLGVRLGIACSNTEKLGLEVSQLQSALETVEGERDEKAEVLAQCQAEVEGFKDCYLEPELAVEKLVRRGEFAPWGDMTRAAPGDVIQFRISIRGAAKNVYLRDILPLGLGDVKSLRVDGELVPGDVSELFLSNIVGEIEITYQARLSHSLGEVSLVNQVIVWADCLEEQVSQARVEVKPRPVPPSSCCKPAPSKDKCDEGGPKDDPDPNK